MAFRVTAVQKNGSWAGENSSRRRKAHRIPTIPNAVLLQQLHPMLLGRKAEPFDDPDYLLELNRKRQTTARRMVRPPRAGLMSNAVNEQYPTTNRNRVLGDGDSCVAQVEFLVKLSACRVANEGTCYGSQSPQDCTRSDRPLHRRA